jgi:hypothetical protein
MAAGDSCIPKKKIKRFRLFALDSCGRMIITGTPVLDWIGFEAIKWANLIDDGTDETITGIDGTACVDDQACPVDRGTSFTLTECKENWSLAAMAGLGSLVSSGGSPVGFNRTKMTECNNLAAEILFEVPTVCDASGAPQCIAMLVPQLSLFKDVRERVADGKTTLRGEYTAKAKLNSRLFELTGAGPGFEVPPDELSYWTPWITDVEAGTSWWLTRLVDCPADAASACELRALDNI